MKLRILGKILLISLAAAMIGGITMIWPAAPPEMSGEEDNAGTKPVLTGSAVETGENANTSDDPLDKDDNPLCLPDKGIEPYPALINYNDRPIQAFTEAVAFLPSATSSFRQILGNPPARAAPEPRGPL